MDGLLMKSDKGMMATVVRQFTPSRIEQQLLAQVFELVCGQRSELDESRSAVQNMASTPRVSDDEQAIETQLAGRRAA